MSDIKHTEASQAPFDWAAFEAEMQEKHRNENEKDGKGFYEFRFENFPLTAFVLLLGPRGSGKSLTTIYMLFRMRQKVHTCAVFCGSDTPDSIAAGILPDCFVYDAIDLPCLETVRTRAQWIQKTFEATGQMPPHCKSSEVLLIADDVLHDKKKLNSDSFSRVILSGRHDNEGLWILLQYANRFPRETPETD